jgi:carbon starvation protein
MKLGTIALLVLSVLVVHPDLKFGVLQFISGGGPIVPGKLFRSCLSPLPAAPSSGFHAGQVRIRPRCWTRRPTPLHRLRRDAHGCLVRWSPDRRLLLHPADYAINLSPEIPRLNWNQSTRVL